jgi:hypothetical protein
MVSVYPPSGDLPMTKKNLAPAPKTTKPRSLDAAELAKTNGGSNKLFVGGLLTDSSKSK